MPPLETNNSTETTRTVAAIDIGSNSVRMAVAEVLPDGRLEVIEQLQRAVRLGQDTFRRGRLRGQTMRAAVSILRDYRKLLEFYGVSQVRAVATSAVREAPNADTFLDRVFMATGLGVEVIDTSEESRLTYSALRADAGAELDEKVDALVAEVGGGSTLLTILMDGEIVASQSLRLGSIRLQESLAVSEEPPHRAASILRQQIANVVATVENTLPLSKLKTLVAIGGDVRFAAREMGSALSAGRHLRKLRREDLTGLIDQCCRHTPEELVKLYGIDFTSAETLTPALLVYQTLLRVTKASDIVISDVTMRDGLLLDLARSATGQEDESLTKGILHSAQTLAEKYKVEMNHAQQVADLSVKLFDAMTAEHGLKARHRLLLRVAAMVHEVGGFVSNRAHHKHSYYLIDNSEIFGIGREELRLVALVARYHRRSPPKSSHLEYVSMPRERRMVVSKLAAILRVADALEVTHTQQVRELVCMQQDEELLIQVPGAADLTMERRAVASKGDLFEDVYGLHIRLEEMPTTEAGVKRARPME